MTRTATPDLAEFGRRMNRFAEQLGRALVPMLEGLAQAMQRAGEAVRRMFPHLKQIDDYQKWDAALAFGLPPSDGADGSQLMLGLYGE